MCFALEDFGEVLELAALEPGVAKNGAVEIAAVEPEPNEAGHGLRYFAFDFAFTIVKVSATAVEL